MHYTDPATGLFHVGYLHLGASGATTNDLVTYKDLNPNSAPFIRAGGINDPVAVFDGSVIEKGVNGTPTLLYTSVSYLPIQWTIRYTKGSETQSLAYATDGGKNFTKAKLGPVIPSPPFTVNVTGFRDPFVFQNAQVDALLGKKRDTWYTIISGGVHGAGPSLFLYAQYEEDENEFQTWEYLGEWWHEAANSTWTERGWAGRWGFNFEVANFFSLDERGANSDGGETFITLGAEWSYAPIVPQVSDERDMLWAAGKQSFVDGKLTFEPTMAGRLDAGRSAYAAAGKVLSADSQPSWASGAPDRAITYVWLTGDLYGTSAFPTAQQNWTGSLLIPRELSRCYLDVVDNALSREKGAWRIEQEYQQNSTLRLATLCQKIAREVSTAFKSNATNTITLPSGTHTPSTIKKFPQTPKSNHYMLTASLALSSRTTGLKTGFTILSGAHESTRITYDIERERLVVERAHSSAAANTTSGIPTYDEQGLFRLFDMPSTGNHTRIEKLHLTIVVDGGVVEVHANNRFALSTWVRPWYKDSRDIAFFVEGAGGHVDVGNVTVYEGLVDAWPKREKVVG
jgi:beta-fructofuranosidase